VKSYIFTIAIDEDRFEDGEEAYHAYCPGLKGCHTWGHTPEEAMVNIQEAIQLYVDDLIETGEEIPVNPELGILEQDAPTVVVNI
jgi:predicted RNase H-like HicB family nuclease